MQRCTTFPVENLTRDHIRPLSKSNTFPTNELLNPERIQPEDYTFPSSTKCTTTTAILIHDGGGTTYPYHCLGALYRNIYGIRNPHFYSGQTFPGGLPEMGKLYADYIREAVKRRDFKCRRKLDGSVDIVLGGWSLGGLLSLEVAKELAGDRKINIVGMILIDSVYHGPSTRSKEPTCQSMTFSEHNKTHNEVLSLRAMASAVRMISTWTPPRWEARPKAVLLRARDHFPTPNGELSAIDLCRDDDMLGWGEYDADMFVKVLEIPGHHFNLFDGGRIDSTTRGLQNALDKLTQPSARQRMLAELQCM